MQHKEEQGNANGNEKKTRLLIATDNFLPRTDGISKFLSEVVPLIKDDFDVTILCPDYGTIEIFPAAIIQFPLSKRRIGEYQIANVDRKAIAREVEKNDLIFTQSIGPVGYNALKEARKQNKPAVSYLHSREWELFSRYIETKKFIRSIIEWLTLIRMRQAYHCSTVIITSSKGDALLLQRYGIRTPTQILPLGVNPYHFKPEHNKVLAKQAIGLNSQSIVIGYLGRISHEKDLTTLARAFLWLKKSHPNAHLLIVGSGQKKIEEQFKDKQSVTHIQSTPIVLPYLHAMDIFVMPSLTETSSLATLEAMSTAIPVVTTKTGLMKEYVVDAENGYTFPRGDWMRCGKLLRKLADDVMLRKRLGENARKTILNGYVIEMTAKELSRTLKSLVQ
jgi:glycosyltransferase involved in cell wall biosynthesis